MTPLAHRFSRRLVEPLKKREPVYETGSALSQMGDMHCFEVSDVWDVQSDFSLAQIIDVAGNVTFLPAPKTWVEWRWEDGNSKRIAFLFVQKEQEDQGHVVRLLMFLEGTNGLAAHYLCDIRIGKNGVLFPNIGEDSPAFKGLYLGMRALFTIAMINTPKVIGRRQHMPHRGLERDLTRGLGRGKFPLHAWHEIKLEVFKPAEIDDGHPHEAHLTGARALHFCRAHLRVRRGRVEFVSSHWRGDPAIGIKRARYKVAA